MEEGMKVTTVLPREKSLPKDKPLTRWEKFAKTKGILNRKRDHLVYDEDSGEYKPCWGYKPKDDDKIADDWLIPAREEKKGRVEKNNKRQKRNQEEANVATLAGKKEIKEFKKHELAAAIAASKKSTASVGKFDQKLKGEKKMKDVTHQFAPNISDINAEKNSSHDIRRKIVGKDDAVDTNKAARLLAKKSHAENFGKKSKFKT